MLGLQPWGTTGFRLEPGAKVDPAVGLVLTGVRGGQSFMDQVAKLLPPLRRTLPRQAVHRAFVKPEKQRLNGTISGSI